MSRKLLLFVSLIAILVFVNGCSQFLTFIEEKLLQGSDDCKEDQYYDAIVGKCKKIIDECSSDNDCSGYETCEREGIDTHLACRLGEECPTWYRNVCRYLLLH